MTPSNDTKYPGLRNIQPILMLRVIVATVVSFVASVVFCVACADAAPPTFTGNTATVFSPNANVKAHGAKCDGSADDTAAFQAAFNAAFNSAIGGNGTAVIAPGGTCILNGRIKVKGGVGFHGQGSLATTLLQKAVNVDTFYSDACCGAGNELNGSTFSDFQIVYIPPSTTTTGTFTIAAVNSTQSVHVTSASLPFPQGGTFNLDINDGTNQIYGQVTAGWSTTTWTVKTLAVVAGSGAGQTMGNAAAVAFVPTAGAIFDFPWSQHITVARLKTFGGFDGFDLGDPAAGGTTLSRFAIDDSIFENISGWFLHQRGTGGGISTQFSQADGLIDTWAAGTGGVLTQDDGKFASGIFVNHAVFGQFGQGFVWTLSSGGLEESSLDAVQMDSIESPSIFIATSGSANVFRLTFDTFRITQGGRGSGEAVKINGASGTLTDVRILNSRLTGNVANPAPCVSITGAKTSSIDLENNQISECTTGVALDGGDTGTGNYNVIGNTIGQVYGGTTTVTTGVSITNKPKSFSILSNRIEATTPIADASTSAQSPRFVKGNSGYIPTLLSGSTGGVCQAVPISTGTTASWDIPVTLYLTLNGATGVSIVVTGNSASPSVSITADGQSVHVPAGATITPTYTGGPPTWVCVGGQ